MIHSVTLAFIMNGIIVVQYHANDMTYSIIRLTEITYELDDIWLLRPDWLEKDIGLPAR